MNTVINPVNLQPASVAALTEILESVIRELAIVPPESISIFFDGTEVYRHQTQDGRVFWWGIDRGSNGLTSNSISLVSSN